MAQSKAGLAERFSLDPHTADALAQAERWLGRLAMLEALWPQWAGFARGPLAAMAALDQLQARGLDLEPVELLALGPEPRPTRPGKPLRLAVGHVASLRLVESAPLDQALSPALVGAVLCGLEAPQLSRAQRQDPWELQNQPAGGALWGQARRWLAVGLPALVVAGLTLASWEREGPDDPRRSTAGQVLSYGLAPRLGLPAAAFLRLRPALELASAQQSGGCQGLLDLVRRSGAWRTWLLVFLRACGQAAQLAGDSGLAAYQLQVENADLVRTWVRAPRHPLRLLDLLVSLPVIDLPTVAQQLDVTQRTAGLLVSKLLEMGLLVEVTGQRRGRRFAYSPLINLLWPPLAEA